MAIPGDKASHNIRSSCINKKNHVHLVSMIEDIGGHGAAFVECGSQSGRFNITETTFAMIRDLHFIDCGGNS